jgi:hypothetical protein
MSADGLFTDEIAAARAAGKEILGADALVAGRSVCLWYTSGARSYRNVTGDLLYPPDVSSVVPSRYFAPFDAVAEDAQGSSVTYNRQGRSLPSWYMDGSLQLLGLYAGRNPRGDNAGYFLTGLSRRGPVRAIYWCGNHLCRFTERADGDAVLLAVAGAAPPPAAVRWSSSLLTIVLPPDGVRSLRFFVTTPQDAPAAGDGSVRDRIVGAVERVDTRAFLARVDHRTDWSDIFYTREEMVAPYAIERDRPVPFTFASTNPGGAAQPGGALRVATDAVRSVQMLTSVAMPITGAGDYLVGFGLELDRGAIVVSLVDAAGKTLFQTSRTHTEPFVTTRVVESLDHPTAMTLMIWANNQTPSRTSVTIRNAFVQRVDLPERFRIK